MEVNIRDYTYLLPQEKIAVFPLEERDESKLLVYNRGAIKHEKFYNLASYLPPNASLFFNNTKVIQARLLFEKESGAVIEVFLLSPVSPSTLLLAVMQTTSTCQWKCTIGNLRRWKDGIVISKNGRDFTLEAKLINRDEGIVEFRWTGDVTFATIVDELGETPLPPYLKRAPSKDDKTRYQTIYSQSEGAVAAPTAGLHFTERVFESLNDKGIEYEFVTLHVSAGTFQPVKVDNAADHPMHQEQVTITRNNVLSLLKSERLTIPVGTTSMRTLESVYWYGVKLSIDPASPFNIGQQDAYTLPGTVPLALALENVLNRMDRDSADSITGETSIYIMPGYKFKVCRALITNFHQPGSTLMLLVAAFVGPDWKKIYDEALQHDYRFLSYGDSSLLIPTT